MTEMQAEEMKYDENYQVRPGVGKEDVDRILKLPRQLSLALPFLFTPDEVEIHRLTLKYTFGKSEMYFIDQDGRCQNDEEDAELEKMQQDIDASELRDANEEIDLLTKVGQWVGDWVQWVGGWCRGCAAATPCCCLSLRSCLLPASRRFNTRSSKAVNVRRLLPSPPVSQCLQPV